MRMDGKAQVQSVHTIAFKGIPVLIGLEEEHLILMAIGQFEQPLEVLSQVYDVLKSAAPE